MAANPIEGRARASTASQDDRAESTPDASAGQQSYSERVAAQLIEQLEQGTAPWQRPWAPGTLQRPYNPSTNAQYRGFNSIWLQAQNAEDPRWLTYKQAESIGANVRRGERGTVIRFTKLRGEESVLDEDGRQVLDADGKPKKHTVEYQRPRIMHAVVFNGSQIDGLPPLQPKLTMTEHERHEKAEAVLAAALASGITFTEQQNQTPHYNPSKDAVVMPSREQFVSADAYYATALHEVAHATGHSSRLARDLAHPFGSETYAREELRAEIASLMLGMELEVGHDPGQHAAYVSSWIAVLKDDPNELFRAAADAEKIKDYVVALEQQKVVQQDLVQPAAERLNMRDPEKSAMKQNRVNLVVPYRDKDQAKQAGARWDRAGGTWYAPAGVDLAPLTKWLPENQPKQDAPVKLDPVIEFADALKAQGFELERGQYVGSSRISEATPLMDGTRLRVSVAGDTGNERSGFYFAYANDGGHPAGFIQNFRTGYKSNWKSSQKAEHLTDADRGRLKAESDERQRERQVERQHGYETVSDRITADLASGRFSPADPNHPYLVAKGLAGDAGSLLQDDKGRLVVPARDEQGRIWTIQRIGPDGWKGFEDGGTYAGRYHLANDESANTTNPTLGPAAPIVITEGWATGETIRRATGATVVTAFTRGNLEAVANEIRRQHPERAILIAGDNDHKHERVTDPQTGQPKPNPGKVAAEKAAEAVNGYAAIPTFASSSQGSDWNDYRHENGEDALKEAMTEALLLAGRRQLADAHRTGHDAERVTETIRLQQGELDQAQQGDERTPTVTIDARSEFAALRNAVEREGDRQDKSDEIGNGQSNLGGDAEAGDSSEQDQTQKATRSRSGGRKRSR